MLATLLLASLIATTTALQNSSTSSDSLHKLSLPLTPSFTFEGGGIDVRSLLAAINNTLLKYDASVLLPPLAEFEREEGHPDLPDSISLAPRQNNEPLRDNQDLDYDGLVTIGHSSPQTFLMDFDTGKDAQTISSK